MRLKFQQISMIPKHYYLKPLTLFALLVTCEFAPTKTASTQTQPICSNEMCECKWFGFECQLTDQFGLITVDAVTQLIGENGEGDRAIYKIKIDCKREPRDLDLLLSKMTPIILYHEIRYHLVKCFQLPQLLNQQQSNISYAGTVEFDEYFGAPVDFFRNARQLEKLKLLAKFKYVHEPLPSELLHNLTCLKALTLIAYTSRPSLTWHVDLLHTLYNLEALSLELVALHTSLRNLSSAHFRDLHALKQLKLDGNYMLSIPENLFYTLAELNRLSLRLNSLQELPCNLLRAQNKLVRLDLSNNRLQSLPVGLFDHTPLLWELALAFNQLHSPTNVIATVRALRFLYKLDLSHNYFESVWGSGSYGNETLFTRATPHADVQKLVRLEEMLFAEEVDHGVPLEALINQTAINLYGNKLRYFSFDWIAEARIACPYQFDLAANAISSVHAIVKPASGICLRHIFLKRNPLACDCQLAWVYNTNLLTQTDYWSCASPSHLRGKGLQNLQRVELCAWSPAWCPERCACSQQQAPQSALLINCTRAQLQALTQLPRPEQLSLAESTLFLEHNMFYELPSNATFGYANVTRIYAAYNRLSIVVPAHLPPAAKLRILDLRHNKLTRLSDEFLHEYLNESETLDELFLAENPWLCDCAANLLLYTLRAQRTRLPDYDKLRCANFPNFTLANVTFNDICALPASNLSIMLYLIAICLTILLLLSLLTLYYKYELEVRVWLHAHNLCTFCFGIDDLDKDKTFDAFISYSHQDAKYVNEILLPGLESEVPYFRLCTHERNWLAGAYIPEQIVESVAQSRRTIIVLSQHFIASDWGRMEFKTAHQSAVMERRARLIIVKCGELTDVTHLDEELQVYLRMNTYLAAEDARFWQKLRYAMPHKRGEASRRAAGMLELGGKHYVAGEVELREFNKRREA